MTFLVKTATDAPKYPPNGSIWRVLEEYHDADGLFYKLEGLDDIYDANAFRVIAQHYSPWIDWRRDLRKWGCRV